MAVSESEQSISRCVRPRRRRSRRWAIATLVTAELLCGAPIAIGAPDQEAEPNDNLFQINGPISPEGVTGALGTNVDRDLFLVRMRPQRQIRFRVEVLNGNTCSRDVTYLWRTEGSTFAEGFANGGFTSERFVTTPGVFGEATKDSYLRVSGEPGCAYRFTVTDTAGGPTDAIDNSPLPVVPVIPASEPNDLTSQAFGPLAANTLYEGGIETGTDVDYLKVFLRPGTNATVELAAASGEAFASITTLDDSSVDSVSTSANEAATTTFSVGQAAHRIRISGDVGARWRLKITPASAVGSAPVAAVRPQLLSAVVRGRRLTARVRVTAPGRLQIVLVGRGKRIGLTNAQAAGARTIGLSYRRPAGVRKGAYVLEVRFRVNGGPLAIVRRTVIFRR